jgi:ADP-L-glycero-D-manno-heptose 6-epimerase
LNLNYSKSLWNYATQKKIPFIYASSAATYGAGEHGYDDNHDIVNQLTPLNPYGVSKNEFDKWALTQSNQPLSWTGLKFFNVYGPNESHKARMASVIFHSFNQIKQTGLVKLFKSHKEGFKDGEQLRDFVYVKDLVKVIGWMLHQMMSNSWDANKNGLYNLGTGKARSFYDLAANTFKAQGLAPNIEFIDMPLDIRDKYQYFTEANMAKLRTAGYTAPFYSLEEGVNDYVANYLLPAKGY